MTAIEIALVLALCAAGATVHGSVGIGFGLVAGPTLVLIDPAFAPGPLLFAGQVVALRHVVMERGHADRGAWRHCLWGLPFGLIAGLVVLASMDRSTLGLLVGGLTVVATLLLLAGVAVDRSRPIEIGAGAASAFSATTAGLPGPPLVVAFSDMEPAALRSTTAMFTVMMAVLTFGALVATDNFGTIEVGLLALQLPGVAIGLLAARVVRRHVDRPWFRQLVLVVAMLGGLVLVVRSF